jgi:hypothetical protein
LQQNKQRTFPTVNIMSPDFSAKIAAIGMLSFYLPQSFWTGLAQKVTTSELWPTSDPQKRSVSAAFLALKLEREEMHGTS